MTAKPRLRIVAGQPVAVTTAPTSSSPLAVARQRAGGRFGWEKSPQEFPWTQEPKVLTLAWLTEQQAKRKK